MDPSAAYALYRRKVMAQPPLEDGDGALFAAMRAQDPKANLRVVMGISRWVIERIESLPAHSVDLLQLLTDANAVVNRELQAYRGESVPEFRARLLPALDRRLRESCDRLREPETRNE
ncbi:MAG: hypothetical protein HYY18_19365 [Planctomycetes bacterium]|nr:hypothetical protein [Planctomycetota bacterium]